MVQQEDQVPIPAVYRRIYRLPVTFKEVAARVPYVVALDRHGMCVASLRYTNSPTA
jgi:hypothetical protein